MQRQFLPSVSQFIEERKFLKNVTPKTLLWYHCTFTSFNGCETEQDYKKRIVELRARGISPISINCWLRAVNGYLNWSKADFRMSKLKEEKKLLATFSPEQVSKLLAQKQKSLSHQRAQILVALLLDTGLRIAEALSLRRGDCDLENLLLRVVGKGRKERRVPISLEGRKRLYGWLKQHNGEFVFTTGNGQVLTDRNAQRDVKALCSLAGITGVRCSPHTLRHTFAVNYLRRGGNLEYLRRILGHSSILVTQRYLQSLQPEDLQQVHERLSPLSQL